MTVAQYLTLAIMAVFYIAYFTKQMIQRRQGVTTMILGKGDKLTSQRRLEIMLKVATFAMPAIEVASMWRHRFEGMPSWVQFIGDGIAAAGVAFFIAGMATMKGSWRAGIPSKKETALVTSGIYRISRNPAFVGFDLMYIGILVAYPNAWHATAVAITIDLLHKQILGEEKFLEGAFGPEYLDYKQKVRRYI